MNTPTKLKVDPAGLTGSVVIDESDDIVASVASTTIVVDDDNDGALKKATLPPEAKLNDDGTVTLTLSKPVTLTVKRGSSGKATEEVYKTLTFYEMTGLDRRLANQAPEEQREVMVVARSTRIASIRMAAIMDLLGMRDIKRIEKVITFLSE